MLLVAALSCSYGLFPMHLVFTWLLCIFIIHTNTHRGWAILLGITVFNSVFTVMIQMTWVEFKSDQLTQSVIKNNNTGSSNNNENKTNKKKWVTKNVNINVTFTSQQYMWSIFDHFHEFLHVNHLNWHQVPDYSHSVIRLIWDPYFIAQMQRHHYEPMSSVDTKNIFCNTRRLILCFHVTLSTTIMN